MIQHPPASLAHAMTSFGCHMSRFYSLGIVLCSSPVIVLRSIVRRQTPTNLCAFRLIALISFRLLSLDVLSTLQKILFLDKHIRASLGFPTVLSESTFRRSSRGVRCPCSLLDNYCWAQLDEFSYKHRSIFSQHINTTMI
jgi:hypothetical protein